MVQSILWFKHMLELEVWTVKGEQYLRAAYAYLYIRDFQRAETAFEQAIASDPDNPQYYFHASITALRSEHRDKALFLAKEALRLQPENELYQEHVKVVEAAILTVDGQQALEKGNIALAREHFHRALERNPLDNTAADALASLESLSTTAVSEDNHLT